jgi:hypothetical protein
MFVAGVAVVAESVIEVALIDICFPGGQCRFIPEEFILLPVRLDRLSEVAFGAGDNFNFFWVFSQAVYTPDFVGYRDINLQGAEKVRATHYASFY